MEVSHEVADVIPVGIALIFHENSHYVHLGATFERSSLRHDCALPVECVRARHGGK